MNLKEYFEFTETTKAYSNFVESDYLQLGLSGEIGELKSILAKRLRGDEKYKDDSFFFCSLKSELGDILWFFVRILYLNRSINLNPLENTTSFNSFQDQLKIFESNLTDKHYDLALISFQKLCYLVGSNLQEIMELNVNKLTERKNTNTIKSNGESVNSRLEFSLGK